MEVDISRRKTKQLSGTEYTVQLNFKSDDELKRPEKPPFQTHVDRYHHRTTQDAIAARLASSHFRPCLPNENPCLGSCTPKDTWRPCFPPLTLASGKQTHSIDRIGSTWKSMPRMGSRTRGQNYCSFDRNFVLRAVEDQIPIPRAGKLSNRGESLMFPGDRILKRKHGTRPCGKNVGDVVPSLTPRPSDVLILPCVNPKFLFSDGRGYVGFVQNCKCLNLEGGSLLLRIFKFQDSCSLRIRQQVQLFLVTVDGGWRLKGTLESNGNLQDPCPESNYKQVPVRHRRALLPNTSDLQCIPQRGDLIIREPWKDLYPCKYDNNECLLWWRPNLELELNDILVRACVWNCCGKFEGFVDLYYYNGKGIRWVFLGRDETVLDPGRVGGDSDSSDDERWSRERIQECYQEFIPRPSPCAGNWPAREPENSKMPGCKFPDCESIVYCE